MLISRGSVFFRRSFNAIPQKKTLLNIQSKRCAGHLIPYRVPMEPERESVLWAEAIGGIMWWWIFWNLYHDHKHITGEWPWPDTSAWKDEELGIPSC